MEKTYCDLSPFKEMDAEQGATFDDLDGTCAQLEVVQIQIGEAEDDYRTRVSRLMERLSRNKEVVEILAIMGDRELLDLTRNDYAVVSKLMRTRNAYGKLFEAATIVAWARTFVSERAAILEISEVLGEGYSEGTVKNLLNLHAAFFEILTEEPPLLPDEYVKGLSLSKLYLLSEPAFAAEPKPGATPKPNWVVVDGRIELRDLHPNERRTDPVEYPDKETLRRALKGEFGETEGPEGGDDEYLDDAHNVIYKDYRQAAPEGGTRVIKTVNVIPDDLEALDAFRPTQDATIHAWYEHIEQDDGRLVSRCLTYLDPFTKQSFQLELPDVESTHD